MIDDSYAKIWDETLSRLKDHVNQPVYNTFLKDIRLVSTYDDIFVVATEDVSKNVVEKKYTGVIEDILQEVTGRRIGIRVVTKKDDLSDLNLDSDPARDITAAEQTAQEYRLNALYTFENFVVGKSNQFAHAASLAIAENMAHDLNDKKVYNPLFIYGGSGLGKTHLMHAIAHHILRYQPRSKIIYVSSEKFTNEMIDSIRDNRPTDFRDKYRKVDVLLIDDIQFLARKEGTQEEFFHTFNELYEANKQIIISSDRPPKEIPTLEERLRTRFEWGLITDIQSPDLETRIAILRKKAQMDKKDVPNEVTTFMAEHIESNIRELEGALLNLTAFASMSNLPITMDMAENFLSSYFQVQTNRPITGESIQKAVCETYGVRKEDLTGKRRNRNVVFPRQVSMYICRELTDLSLPKIGEIFGGRDHTTVMHAIEKIETSMKKDPVVRATVMGIMKELKGE